MPALEHSGSPEVEEYNLLIIKGWFETLSIDEQKRKEELRPIAKKALDDMLATGIPIDTTKLDKT